jgi:hypothetical protein
VDGHQQLINGLPHQAQTYPPALVKAIVDGLIQDWVDQQQGGQPDCLTMGISVSG